MYSKKDNLALADALWQRAYLFAQSQDFENAQLDLEAAFCLLTKSSVKSLSGEKQAPMEPLPCIKLSATSPFLALQSLSPDKKIGVLQSLLGRIQARKKTP